MKNKILEATAGLCLAAISFASISCSTPPQRPNSMKETYPMKQTHPVEITTTAKVGQYKVVDTGQKTFFNNSKSISQPSAGQPFYGQDAQFNLNTPSYTNNGDGTITDQVSGLMWQKAYEVMTYDEAVAKVKTFNLAKQTDWRIPTIKEAYSLILFSGADISSREMSKVPEGGIPFLDTNFFDFDYGSNGQRVIDVQILSSTVYRRTPSHQDARIREMFYRSLGYQGICQIV